jgi:hypothetical protein
MYPMTIAIFINSALKEIGRERERGIIAPQDEMPSTREQRISAVVSDLIPRKGTGVMDSGSADERRRR